MAVRSALSWLSRTTGVAGATGLSVLSRGAFFSLKMEITLWTGGNKQALRGCLSLLGDRGVRQIPRGIVFRALRRVPWVLLCQVGLVLPRLQ